jgi:hypothetical protein
MTLSNYIIRMILSTFVLLALTGCIADDNNEGSSSISQLPLDEGTDEGTDSELTGTVYAAMLIASDFSSSQVAIGSVSDDRSVSSNILAKASSSYTLSSYDTSLYHIGQFFVDTISLFDLTDSYSEDVWTYSTNEEGDSSANAYTLVQNADDNAYLIRYGASTIWQVDPSATEEAEFIKDTIDLSAYTVTEGTPGTVPNMSDAVISGNTLFVSLQRLDGFWAPQQAYLAAIDLSTNEEIDTDPQTDGLKGIPLNGSNTLKIEAHNGSIYVVGRGNFDTDLGGVDKVDATTYEVTHLIDETSFDHLNDAANSTYAHPVDIAVVDDSKLYVLANLEQVYTTASSHIFEVNPTTTDLSEEITFDLLDGSKLSEIAAGPNDRLWVAQDSAEDPGILVFDTDTHTQNGDRIELDMPATRIVFLETE